MPSLHSLLTLHSLLNYLPSRLLSARFAHISCHALTVDFCEEEGGRQELHGVTQRRACANVSQVRERGVVNRDALNLGTDAQNLLNVRDSIRRQLDDHDTVEEIERHAVWRLNVIGTTEGQGITEDGALEGGNSCTSLLQCMRQPLLLFPACISPASLWLASIFRGIVRVSNSFSSLLLHSPFRCFLEPVLIPVLHIYLRLLLSFHILQAIIRAIALRQEQLLATTAGSPNGTVTTVRGENDNGRQRGLECAVEIRKTLEVQHVHLKAERVSLAKRPCKGQLLPERTDSFLQICFPQSSKSLPHPQRARPAPAQQRLGQCTC